MKNTLLFTYSANILVRLLAVSEELSYPKNPKMCYSILAVENATAIIVNPVVKRRPHPAAHPH